MFLWFTEAWEYETTWVEEVQVQVGLRMEWDGGGSGVLGKGFPQEKVPLLLLLPLDIDLSI